MVAAVVVWRRLALRVGHWRRRRRPARDDGRRPIDIDFLRGIDRQRCSGAGGGAAGDAGAGAKQFRTHLYNIFDIASLF